MERPVIRIRTIWLLALLWVAGNSALFILGWIDFRGMSNGNLNVLSFSAALTVLSRNS
jgi:hypothetical protein